jgi:hypothetical protein
VRGYHLKLEFGAYWGFACLPVGSEFVVWDFRWYGALSALWGFLFEEGQAEPWNIGDDSQYK